jgi:hypothetical protein
MKTKKAPADEAAERLAEIVEAHLDRMSPAERLDRLHALHQVAVKAGTRAKSGSSRPTAVNRSRTLKRA